jgi:hypothetical protein
MKIKICFNKELWNVRGVMDVSKGVEGGGSRWNDLTRPYGGSL